jgi:hypothetical protein
MASKFEMSNLPSLRPNYSGKPALGWCLQPRETSFLVMEQSQIAVRMFNDLLCIMGDKIALYPEMYAADIASWSNLHATLTTLCRLSNELLSQVSQQPALRDELAVQICSQLTNNPNSESLGRGWDFLEKVCRRIYCCVATSLTRVTAATSQRACFRRLGGSTGLVYSKEQS